MVSRNADLYQEWVPITDSHEAVIEDYRDSFTELSDNKSPDPLAVVGAYGSGKTQLMYQIFREAWEQNIGAVYVGDPGKLLSEFESAAESKIEVWLEERIQEEVGHYISGSPEDVSWFPNAEPEQKAEWLDTTMTVDDPDDISKYAILVDEVEQHYEDFLAVVETDDDNPLRVINDEVTNTLKLWSFGMLSAYEFLGEADWRRLEELRVPPLDVAEVESRLDTRDEPVNSLANIIWWMGRGRTGLIIKLIDELPHSVSDDISGWLGSMADRESQGTPIINDIWANLGAEHWDSARRSLAFLDGYDEWLLRDSQGYPRETMTNLVSDVIFNTKTFADTEQDRTAKRIIRRNIDRVFDGVIRPEAPYFPYQRLMFESAEIDGLLSLIEDQILTFEPKGPARQKATDALELEPEKFTSEFYSLESDQDDISGDDYFCPKLSLLDDTFQPIALNPDLVSKADTKSLRESMDTALEFVVSGARSRTRVYFCTTQAVLDHQLRVESTNYDITSPSVIIAPADLTEDIASRYDTFRRLNLLTVAPHESSMLWDFVVNLRGALKEQGFNPERPINEKSRQRLLEAVDTRDARNTIETLFDQLQRVATDEATKATEAYADLYSLPNESVPIWETSRLQDDKPFWTTGEIRELTRTQAYLLMLSELPEFRRPYGSLHSDIQKALDNNLISGGSKFPYTEFLTELYTGSGFAETVATERQQFFDNDQLVDGALNTRDALYQLAKEFDLNSTTKSLNDIKASAADGDITVLDIDISKNALAFLRALLMSKIAIDETDEFALTTKLENLGRKLGSYRSDFDVHLSTIEEYDTTLTSPEYADVGAWPSITPDEYRAYHDLLETLSAGTDNLAERTELQSGISPYAWVYLLMLREFLSQVSAAADEYETEINTVDLNNVRLLKESYDDLYKTIIESDVALTYFDSRNQLEASLESIGNGIFDYGEMTRIPLPNHIDQLTTIDNAAQQSVEQVEDIRDLMEQMQETRDSVETEAANLQTTFVDLLEEVVDAQEETV